jgi:hypothetical protein
MTTTEHATHGAPRRVLVVGEPSRYAVICACGEVLTARQVDVTDAALCLRTVTTRV